MENETQIIGESKFTGGLLGMIGIGILQGLLITFTLGFGAPWAICMAERWYAKHTYIDASNWCLMAPAVSFSATTSSGSC